MKILVFSDSHGKIAPMERAIISENPDHVLHLGDCVRDFRQLQEQFPQLPMTNVPGNCDYGDLSPHSLAVTLDSVRIFMTHGHVYQVKYMYLRAIYAALEQESALLLFGHTHRPECFQEKGLWAMNPGAARNGCYGVVETDYGTFQLHLKTQS